MSTKLVPDNWRVFAGRQILESITEQANSSFYLFVGEHVDRLETQLPEALDDPQQIYVDAYHNMIFGKRISNNDVSLMIRNIPYATGYYDMYDDGDPLLDSKDYYAITNAGSFYHVWKVLDNNNGANSSVSPQFSDIDINDEIYQTSDGYRWKYMYSVDTTKVSKFATSSYFPLVPNTDVATIAKNGSIDVIQIKEKGAGYNNYLNGTFSTGDLRINGNTILYGIGSNSVARTVNGYYTDCMLYISTGTGVGQYKKIVDYFSNANGKFAVLESEFLVPPDNGDTYEINPIVTINGDGQQTSNAEARALVNAVGNSIYRVEMLSRGENYRYVTATVDANAVVGVVSEANVRPIYVPQGGHGADAALELRAKAITFSVQLSNTESNTVPAINQFQQYGLIVDPSFSNVQITFEDVTSVPFIAGETITKFSTRYIDSGAVTSITSANLTISNAQFDAQLVAGDWIFVQGDTEQMLTMVNSVVNSSTITLPANSLFTDANSMVYLATLGGNAVVTDRVSSTTIRIANLNSQWATGDILIGNTSGAMGTIETTAVNGVEKSFSTFVGMHKYTGSYDTGTFIENEKVYVGDSLSESTANASLHSAVSNGSTIVVYVSNQVGVFTSTMVGADSGATFTITNSYSPDIDFGSGKVIYLENINAVDRNESKTENFKVTFKF